MAWRVPRSGNGASSAVATGGGVAVEHVRHVSHRCQALQARTSERSLAAALNITRATRATRATGQGRRQRGGATCSTCAFRQLLHVRKASRRHASHARHVSICHVLTCSSREPFDSWHAWLTCDFWWFHTLTCLTTRATRLGSGQTISSMGPTPRNRGPPAPGVLRTLPLRSARVYRHGTAPQLM